MLCYIKYVFAYLHVTINQHWNPNHMTKIFKYKPNILGGLRGLAIFILFYLFIF